MTLNLGPPIMLNFVSRPRFLMAHIFDFRDPLIFLIPKTTGIFFFFFFFLIPLLLFSKKNADILIISYFKQKFLMEVRFWSRGKKIIYTKGFSSPRFEINNNDKKKILVRENVRFFFSPSFLFFFSSFFLSRYFIKWFVV